MPRFLAYCPDYPDALLRRLQVRPVHLVRAQKDLASGVQTEGSPFVPQPGTPQATREVPEGGLNICGSFMIYHMDTIEDVWARIKSDVYWENNVWDKEKMGVWQLMN